VALKTVIQPLNEADGDSSAVYAALDDPRADWSKAVVAMLSRGAIELTGEQAIERFRFMQSLEERFDAEMKDRNKSDEDEEPGIWKPGLRGRRAFSRETSTGMSSRAKRGICFSLHSSFGSQW
jgi:hypothetical protein